MIFFHSPLLSSLILFFFYIKIIFCIKNHCPVTSRYKTSEDGYLPYPSFYWPEKPHPEPGEEFFNCSIIPIYPKPIILGKCMPKRPCLISDEIIAAALEPQTWIPSMNGICLLEKHISESRNEQKQKSSSTSTSSSTSSTASSSSSSSSSTASSSTSSSSSSPTSRYSLNLIIIGGSMPKGSGTDGRCICIQSEDSNCALIDRNKLDISFCSWVTHFIHWIQTEFPMIYFKISDFTHGGMASYLVPDILDPYLRQLTITGSDIIIIDESVNDLKRYQTLILDIEIMFRRLLHHASGTSTSGGTSTSSHLAGNNYPTIIMIEQFPHRSQIDGLGHRDSYQNRILPNDYATVYRKLSQYYHFPLYSLREVYWTYYNENITQSHRYPISPYDSWHLNAHPPWYFHNYMADVIADCFLHSLSQCRHMRESKSSSSSSSSPPSSSSSPVTTPYILPPPYTSSLLLNANYCDISEPYLLNSHANNYYHPKNLTQYEQGRSGGGGGGGQGGGQGGGDDGWREYVDYHNTSGWIINHLSNPKKRDLIFHIPNQFPVTAASSSSWTGLVVIMYLQSYENMGQAQLYLCGEETSLLLDGLLQDYQINKISIPTMATYKINSYDARRCNQLSDDDQRTVMIRYQPERVQTPSSSSSSSSSSMRDSVRHHQKMKIMSVEICTKGNR
jgi:hypothetical protein